MNFANLLTILTIMERTYIEMFGYTAWCDLQDYMEMVDCMENGTIDPNNF